MKITWIGHACFKLEKGGCSVVTDPYEAGYVPGLGPVKEKAAGVYFSHHHKDHYTLDAVECEEGSELPGVTVIKTWHDSVQGAERGENLIHIFDFGGEKAAHLGDLGCRPDDEQMELLKGLDVLLIPIGGFFTIDAVQAAGLVRELSPRIVVPMHFRDDGQGFGYELIGTAEPFAEAFKGAEFMDSCTLDTEEVQAQVVVLKPQNVV